MAKSPAFSKSLAHRIPIAFCEHPVVNQLTPEQMAALHACQHEVMASIFRLYTAVPANLADVLLSEFLKKIPLDPAAAT